MVKKITDSKWFYILVSILLAFALWIYVGKEANPLTTNVYRFIIGLKKYLLYGGCGSG